MCLLAFALHVHPSYPLVLIGNRDEFHARQALPAHWWHKSPVLAGRDLVAGGTWLGMTRHGRIATVTNYRDPERHRDPAPSRGHLVLDALEGGNTDFLASLVRTGSDYNGFNLLWGDPSEMWYCHNQGGTAPKPLQPGVYGLSNGLLDTPWPKLIRTRQSLSEIISSNRLLTTELFFPLLQDRHTPPDHTLPDTGLDWAWERLLSSAFILDPDYGTRASTVILIGTDGKVDFHERTFNADGAISTDRAYHFRLAS